MARRRRPCLTISLVCLVCCSRCIGAPRRDGRDETSDGSDEEVEEEAVEVGVCAHDGDLVRTTQSRRRAEPSRVVLRSQSWLFFATVCPVTTSVSVREDKNVRQ